MLKRLTEMEIDKIMLLTEFSKRLKLTLSFLSMVSQVHIMILWHSIRECRNEDRM